MFLIKIFHFLKGYVILSLSGHNKEGFLNALLNEGVCPENLNYSENKIFLEIRPKDFFKIRKPQSRANVHIEEKHGLVFLWEGLKKRKLFLIGMTAFFLFLAASSQFVWTIEYDGAEKCDFQRLAEAVELAGIKPGVLKHNLNSAQEMKNIILNNTDDVTWCWVYIKGTRAVVKVRKIIEPPELFDPNIPCDIIAMRQGIIKRVITYQGKCVVEPEQAVAPGDTIISGTYEFDEQNGYQVHSRGIVEAYTQHIRSGTYKQVYCYKTYTGRKQRFLTLKLYNWEIPLYIKNKIKFEQYDTNERDYDLKIGREHYVGIGFNVRTCEEFYEEKEPISYDTAVEFAVRDLEAEIAKELLPPSQLIDKDVTVENIDAETLSVTVTMDFIEQIGAKKQIEEVKNIEPKTNNSSGGD